MYPIDERDRVVELADLPKPRGGAPTPFIIVDEVILLLSYLIHSDLTSDSEAKSSVAIVQFPLPLIHFLGPPNDEAIAGHPLWRRGLESCAAYRVEDSSLIRRLGVMNYVHPRNDPAAFDKFQHYVITFQDCTFECVAQSYAATVERMASEGERYLRMIEIVNARDERRRSEIRGATERSPLSTRLRWWVSALNPWSH